VDQHSESRPSAGVVACLMRPSEPEANPGLRVSRQFGERQRAAIMAGVRCGAQGAVVECGPQRGDGVTQGRSPCPHPGNRAGSRCDVRAAPLDLARETAARR